MSEMLCPDIQVFHVDDPRLGIIVYRNALSEKAKNVIERLESTISQSVTPPYMWMESLVGDQVKMPEYRDCHDCKIGKQHAEKASGEFAEIKNIYSDVAESLEFALVDYEARYNIKMDYMEAINFVRYNPGEHFGIHTDHGFSYNCTVSSCLYLNDNYEGGELHFPHLNITIKPQAGDNIMFPSTYIYAHGALPVTSGTKYVAVTMFDYNDRTHKHGYGENIDGSKATEGAGIPQYAPGDSMLKPSSYGRFGLNK